MSKNNERFEGSGVRLRVGWDEHLHNAFSIPKSNWMVFNNFENHKFHLHFALTHFKNQLILISHFTTIELKPKSCKYVC